jgi:hypothetical protein
MTVTVTVTPMMMPVCDTWEATPFGNADDVAWVAAPLDDADAQP